MSLLQLKDIGKIYVSEGNVSVGIRGVNLSFDKGEFVAITGASGSGKSTLLNVISGMDTYEEGELFIENEPTSHFMQPEWEEYRKKYISFIFQEYNIIESYTVLQNVELALMHIENKKERRARAIDLLNRVGMGSHLKHKGSKLSGGQKQRTVIARALAKDSPIILADEPTGNLDSETSKEIISLMKEIAKDKLLIVVTHNFDQVEDHATRHIRVFDGAIESDQQLRPAPEDVWENVDEAPAPEKKKKNKKLSDAKNGLTLGSAIFRATPKLSLFMCILMLVGTLGIFFSIATFGNFTEMFKPSYMFNNIDGRLVLAKRDGNVVTDSELEDIKTTYGAKSHIHYDFLLDKNMSNDWSSGIYYEIGDKKPRLVANYVFGENLTPLVGRQPEKENEVLLSLPISYQNDFGNTELKITELEISGMKYDLVGVHYYADNNLTPKALLSEAGFKFMSVYNKSFGNDDNSSSNLNMWFNAYFIDKNDNSSQIYSPNHENIYKDLITVSFDGNVVPNGKIAICDSNYIKWEQDSGLDRSEIELNLRFSYDYYTYTGYESKNERFEKNISTDKLVFNSTDNVNNYKIIFSPAALIELMEEYLSKSYTQASVFFENNAEAKAAAEKLNALGYIAVPANTTYEPDPIEMISNTLSCIVTLIIFLFITVFLAFFINLCSSRTLSAFKGDMAIMRSMGITVSVIKVGMYVRMFVSLIPAFILLAVCPYFIYTSPAINAFFTFLYPYQYAIIVACMIFLTYMVTHRQVKKLFNESVKKSLKGGSAE